MSRRPPIEYEVSPCFEVINWQGEKGEVAGLGRIAFLPKSVKQEFQGRKVSFIFRGRGYRDPYTGSELRKGYVIALPVEMLNDVRVVSVEVDEVLFGEGIDTVQIKMIADYEKEYKGGTIRGRVNYYETVALEKVINRPLKEVISELFSDVIQKAEKIDCHPAWLGERDIRNGYIATHYELSYDENTGYLTLKTKSRECLSYAPLEVLLNRFDSLEVEAVAHYTIEKGVIERWKSSHLHKCLENYIWISPEKPVYSCKSFKLSLDEFHELLSTGKIQVTELKMQRIHDIYHGVYKSEFCYWEEGHLKEHSGYFSFDEFLNDLKEYDLKEINEHISRDKKRLEEIESRMHYYIKMTKDEIAEMFRELTGVSMAEKIIISFASGEYRSDEEIEKDHKEMQKNISEILEKIDREAWVKVLSRDADWSGMYIESKKTISIVIPEKNIEIVVRHKRYTDGYEEESGEFIKYKTNEVEITEVELERQEKEREQEIQRLNREIRELEEKKNLIEQKSPKDLYGDIVGFFYGKEARE